MDQLNKTINDIKSLKIQGANAIAIASLNTIKKINDKRKYNSAIKKLISARPTEPLNHNCLNFVKFQIKNNKTTGDVKLKVNNTVEYLLELIKNNRQKIIKNGQKLTKNNQNIFTHCHSSTVEKILVESKKSKKNFKVYNTETRPMFQGRITAKNLIKHKIPVTMVADSAASFLISKTSGKDLMMDITIIGADAVLPDGSIINKIGSYGIGLSCYQTKVPLYIACNLLKFDKSGIIPIEIRPEEEIWPGKPKNLKIINFAFDIIPARFIKGYITEFGIIKPYQIKSYIKKNYPWLNKI